MHTQNLRMHTRSSLSSLSLPAVCATAQLLGEAGAGCEAEGRGRDTECERRGGEGAREEGARWGTARVHTVYKVHSTHTHTSHARHTAHPQWSVPRTEHTQLDPDRLTLRVTRTSEWQCAQARHRGVRATPVSRFRTSTDSSRSHTDTPVLGDVKDRSCHRC